MATFLIQSQGCKVNQYDGGRLQDLLMQWGLQPVGENEAPDLFILNSCAVTGRASQKARQALNGARREWPSAKIILAGCEAKLRELQETPSLEADAVISPALPQARLKEIILGLAIDLSESRPVVAEVLFASHRTRAFLKIQDGCRHFCSYCIVPYLRGEEYSKPIEEALAEARQLAAQGYLELVLTGIHLGRYAPGLIPFLVRLEEIPELKRIRLSSIEPHEITDELIAWLASSPKACKHLHLPLQAGHDVTLKRMNRPYSTDEFRRIVQKIRERIPGIAITTDFIVGFPGETEEHFSKGIQFVESIGFSRMHIFRFSPRKGTPAADFPDQLSNADKKLRSHVAEEVWKSMANVFHGSFVGKRLEVLWERFDGTFWTGFSREYIPCQLKAPASLKLENTISEHLVDSCSEQGVFLVPI